ncbi:MAG: SLBB domain-containing protein, partial [Myxococcales bacterium]|nr:SLBB domain-containing protein [Myxococcales bacterium]
GRGGAGFPAGIKLQTVKDAPSATGQKYVVVNADEGDAGAFIDKELLEQAPHTVLEGTILAAYAVGASEGYVYLRGEYPRAIAVWKKALADAREAGILGGSVLGSGFAFDVKLVEGHGAYICGEETSLLRSLEGVPAQVSPKPPFPAIQGLNGAPTVVNNVETLAAYPWIVERGGDAYAALGAGKSRGTKLVSVSGHVAKPGLFEVELGTSLRSILFELAGGVPNGKRFKAVQIGGPLGGILGEAHLDLPMTFEDLAAAGGMLGHAGMVVYDEDVDLVRIGRGLMKFCAVESCGKCFPCRIGSVRATEIFDKVLEGRGTQADIELLGEINETMRVGSLCALGGGIPIPVENLLTSFVSELDRYVPGAKAPVVV